MQCVPLGIARLPVFIGCWLAALVLLPIIWVSNALVLYGASAILGVRKVYYNVAVENAWLRRQIVPAEKIPCFS